MLAIVACCIAHRHKRFVETSKLKPQVTQLVLTELN